MRDATHSYACHASSTCTTFARHLYAKPDLFSLAFFQSFTSFRSVKRKIPLPCHCRLMSLSFDVTILLQHTYCASTLTHIHTHTHAHTHRHSRTHTQTLTHTHTDTHAHTHRHSRKHTQTLTHTHTDIHAHTHLCLASGLQIAKTERDTKGRAERERHTRTGRGFRPVLCQWA